MCIRDSTITAKAAGSDVGLLISRSVPLWLVMSLVTAVVAYILFRRDMRRLPLPSPAPVSYTHLDVYKRQAPYRPKGIPLPAPAR